MLIFLDSNIICADYKMKSPSFEVAQKVGTIVLGQIVVDEVCKQSITSIEIDDINDYNCPYCPY